MVLNKSDFDPIKTGNLFVFHWIMLEVHFDIVTFDCLSIIGVYSDLGSFCQKVMEGQRGFFLKKNGNPHLENCL